MVISELRRKLILNKLMSLSEALLANLSALPGRGVALAMKGIYTRPLSPPLGHLNPDGCSWSKSQQFLVLSEIKEEGSLAPHLLGLTSGDWPRSAIWDATTVSPLAPLVRLIEETESGFLPTPDTMPDAPNGSSNVTYRPKSLLGCAKEGWMPTPTARDYKDGSAQSCANVPANGLLGRVVHKLPKTATPQSGDYRTGRAERWDNPDRSRNLNDQAGGKLSTIFVEWLMSFPIGWTDSKAWGMRSSPSSRTSSAKPSTKSNPPDIPSPAGSANG